MARFALDYVPNGTRDYRATPKTPGSFSRGNRNSTYLGRDMTRGLLAKVGNPANPSAAKFFPPRKSDDGSTAPLRGRVCPGCGIETPVSAKCNECW